VLGEFIPRFEAAADGTSYALCVIVFVIDSGSQLPEIALALARLLAIDAQHHVAQLDPGRRDDRSIEDLVDHHGVLDPTHPERRRSGTEILPQHRAVDEPVRIGRYIPASTPQAHRRNIASNLLGGPEGSIAKLRIRSADGAERNAEIARSVTRNSALAKTPWRSGEVLRWLPGNIGYADLDRLELEQVDELFAKFADAKAIVFDMRGYPRGTGFHIAPRLADRPRIAGALFRQPRVWPSMGMFGRDELGDVTEFLQTLPPPRSDRPLFKGPTVLLIDERTQSQAEHTGLWLKAANGTIWIGSASAGANGDITTLVVPGGITLTFTGQAVLHPDGRQLQRIGLTPDVEVHPTIAGVRAGRDEVLEAALATIDKRLAGR
jgi:C-terminal processing protease CtpA/Prc